MLSTIFSPISCCSGSRNAASAAATRVTGSGDSISRVVNGMNEERYNVAGKIYAGEWNFVPQAISGERMLVACWLRRYAATNFPLLRAEFASGQHYQVRDGRMPSPARSKRALPEGTRARGETRFNYLPYAKENRTTFRRSGRAVRRN